MIDGHSIGLTKCPLSVVKRISQFHMFAYDPKRSLSTAYCGMLGKFGDDTQMVLHRIAHWSLVTTTIFAVTAAVAQTGGPGRGADGGKFRAACGDDLQRFCANVQPGGGRVVQCLSSHTPELSESCETMIADARGGTKLRAACGDDLKRFCADVRPGGGRLVQCLSSHAREVSPACGNTIAAMHARTRTPDSSAQSPTAQPAVPATAGNPPATMGSILRASCGPDAQRLCAEARREIDVLRCLESRRLELTTVCKAYFEKLGARPTVQRNIPSKKPPSLPPAAPPAKPPGNDNPPEPGPG
jgi:hypothetical protein